MSRHSSSPATGYLFSTVLVLTGLGMNHRIYGAGCWGAQAGGTESMRLYYIQLLIAIVAVSHAGVILLRRKPAGWQKYLTVLGAGAAGTTVFFILIGWRINTTVHRQGPENLIPFLAASFTALTAGFAIIHAHRWNAKLQGTNR